MIYEKLFNLQKEFETLQKSENNPFFKSKYLPLEDILNHFIPLLNKHKLVCYTYTKEDLIITKLLDFEDQTFIESEFKIFNTDPQKRGSEITYWRRYNLLQLLNINTEDDDWNIASSEWNTKQFYKKEWRDLLEVITDMKASKTREDLIKFKDEWKLLAKTDKQKIWLENEFKKLTI